MLLAKYIFQERPKPNNIQTFRQTDKQADKIQRERKKERQSKLVLRISGKSNICCSALLKSNRLDKHVSLFFHFVGSKEIKSFKIFNPSVYVLVYCKISQSVLDKRNVATKGKCYETFYHLKLRMFLIGQSVCPWQDFLAQSNVCV